MRSGKVFTTCNGLMKILGRGHVKVDAHYQVSTLHYSHCQYWTKAKQKIHTMPFFKIKFHIVF
jgi:hypothetical protein